ncbi:MAG: NADH-quinone oxidoreductase subunit L, partial [Actinobacteria bacterium]
MTVAAGAWICLAAPLVGCVLIALGGQAISRRVAGWISTLTTFVAFGGALVTFFLVWSESPSDRSHVSTAYTWLTGGSFKVSVQILVDPLSLVMMLIVSGVGGLIVWYSMGYMAGDDEERRYFAYMSLFVFAMLLLVESANFLLLLVGWGLVGLASYLLIGFWHRRPEAIAAAKKAFIMNAIGDATFALAAVLLVWQVGALDFTTVFAQTDTLSSTMVNLIALGLLGGAVAKSAQLPLHTWLPDAMEGPTPVSALIHAATMVTAGVYLLVRAHPIFEQAVHVQHLAAVLGAITLLVAGLVALVQWDIKRVIAYSTMSQIGYMFLGAGIGAYGAAMFHLLTHAFFKALLFMAAGVVIHHLDGEQDMRKMGGLKQVLPRTRLAFLVGTLALVGIPPLAGFWSKDAILASALDLGGGLGWTLYLAGLTGTLLTGAYAFRLYYAIFREPRAEAPGRAWRGAAFDARPGGGPLGVVSDRRATRHPGRVGALLHVDLPERRAARRSQHRRGLPHERHRRLTGPARMVVRPQGVPDRPPARPTSRCVACARAQVLFRRALRGALLPARGGLRERASPVGRGARRRGFDRRDRVGDDPGRRRARAGAVGASAHLRPGHRVRGRRP